MDTDDFEADYLDNLEKSLEHIHQDSLRFMIINDLGYHYHTIALSETDSHLLLKVCDNGVGFEKNTEIKGTGFGTQLVGLLTKQLDGNMTLITSRGTEVFFEFQIGKAA